MDAFYNKNILHDNDYRNGADRDGALSGGRKSAWSFDLPIDSNRELGDNSSRFARKSAAVQASSGCLVLMIGLLNSFLAKGDTLG